MFNGQVKYGQSYYDFDEGGLSFVSPNQVISATQEGDYDGFTLLFHPDFIRSFPLGKKIKAYGFFSYSVAEALFLSEKEEDIIIGLFKTMEMELDSAIDIFSQEVVVSQIDLLLSYSKRFYHRQFITRKAASSDLLVKAEQVLADYFTSEETLLKGLPSVQKIADQFQVTPLFE